MELLAAASDTNHLKDIADTCFDLYESVEHIREEGTLSHGLARAGLAKVRVVHPEPLLQRWINVIHEDAHDVDRVFFEVIEGTDGVEEGRIVYLSREADLVASAST